VNVTFLIISLFLGLSSGPETSKKILRTSHQYFNMKLADIGIKGAFDFKISHANAFHTKSDNLAISQPTPPRGGIQNTLTKSGKDASYSSSSSNSSSSSGSGIKQQMATPGNKPESQPSENLGSQVMKSPTIASQIEKSLTYEAWNDRMPRIGKSSAIGHIKLHLDSASNPSLILESAELTDVQGKRLGLSFLTEGRSAKKQNSLNEPSNNQPSKNEPSNNQTSKNEAIKRKSRLSPNSVATYHLLSSQFIAPGDKLHLSFSHGDQRTVVEVLIQTVQETY